MTLDLLSSALRIATPLCIAAFGELLCERTGLLNLSIEGNMLLGGFVGWIFASATSMAAVGLILSAFCGAVTGVIFWILTDIFELPQHITGLGLGFISQGLALTLFRLLPSSVKNPLSYSGTENASIASAFVLTLIAALLLGRWAHTRHNGVRWNIMTRSLRAADLLGVDVRTGRLYAAILACTTAALAGGVLSVLVVRNFTIGLISGRGWIALCLVILARWTPVRLVPAVFLWALLELAALHAQASGLRVGYELLIAIPYVAGLMVLGLRARSGTPATLLQHYRRSEDAA